VNRLTLVGANLWRKPTRTTLTVLTLVVAFLLFMLLRAVAAAFAGGVAVPGVQRLIVNARYSIVDNLPLAHIQRIRSLPGVAQVTPVVWFGGYYQDPKNSFTKLVIDPPQYFEIFPELTMSDATLERFYASRRGVIVAESLAREYGWQVGDPIPIRGDIWPKEDGSWHWEFELAGTYVLQDGASAPPTFLIQYDYFSESVMFWAKDMIGWAIVRVAEGVAPATVIQAIDGLFENSPDPTKSLSEDDYTRQFANQLGDMGAITTLILAAVFFTVLLTTAHVTSLSFRERVPELAVMKTIGFEDGDVARLVALESMLLCVIGAAGGIALALLFEPFLNMQVESILGAFQTRWTDVGLALVLAAAIGLLIALPSARAARRLAIVDALRDAR
jgi:putative ABC transport system permease protein